MGLGIVKLGEGNWAVKDGNLLAAKETNGRFKNAEFTVARGTRATYVGRDGLIKESNLQDSNLVTNGTFDTDSDWTKGTGWSISGGKARRSGHSVNTDIQQNVPVVNGGLYKFSYTRAYESGNGQTNLYIKLDNVNYSNLGSYTSTVVEEHTVEGYFTTTFTGNLLFRIFGIGDFTGTIDNVSVQEIKTDTPRIDFTDNTDGHLLLEPQSTNLVTYSEDFSQWLPTNVNTTQNAVTSPDGTVNADKLIGTSTTIQHRINFTSSNASGSTTFSFFAKSAEYNSCWARIGLDGAYFDLENGLTGGQSSGITSSIVNYGNGWYRCIITKASSSVNEVCRINLTASYLGVGDFLGDDTSGIYIYGGQHEQLSHLTSYIPTNGSTVTRDADTCNSSGSSADFNSEEGVLYAEIAALTDDLSNRFISLTDGTDSNSVTIYYGGVSNRIRYEVKSSSAVQANVVTTSYDITNYNKIAVKYKANDFALWVNGTNVAQDVNGLTPVGLNDLSFDRASILDFYGKVKAVRVYKEALSDTDLQNLTS